MSLPAVLHIKDLARLLDGWSGDRIRYFLIKNDLARFDEPTLTKKRTVYTTPQIIGERMPDVLVAMTAKWASLEAGKSFDPDDFSDMDPE